MGPDASRPRRPQTSRLGEPDVPQATSWAPQPGLKRTTLFPSPQSGVLVCRGKSIPPSLGMRPGAYQGEARRRPWEKGLELSVLLGLGEERRRESRQGC